MGERLLERSPIRVIAEHLEGGLGGGRLGLIAARAGVGKSTLLVHKALDALLEEQAVLHVSLKDTVEHVRAYYDEIFGALLRSRHIRDKTNALVAAERRRMIHSYLERPFTVEHLRGNLSMLRDVAHFEPAMIVVDGFDDRTLPGHLEGLAALARELSVPVWVTMRISSEASGEIEASTWAHVAVALRLSPDERTVKITLLKPESAEALPVSLDPTTMLVLGEDHGEMPLKGLTPRPADCTLYSGGAPGAEEVFGLASEHWGLNEVSFTFEGHKQARSRGRYELSPRELAAGDVSLVYVSRRLNRTYSEGSLIRRVLQTIWHMVSRSQQVFVVGNIQEDGTVKGGTGWSVELARMWNKSLWVFDQDQNAWFRWDGEAWVQGTPLIESVHFTGTGTRYLTEGGRKAIRELFERSFARRVAPE